MAAPVAKDQELELDIESLAFGGNGVARLNGFVVFVRRGLPGDRVRARITKVQRRHAEALATEVLQPGPVRVDARVVGPARGGQGARGPGDQTAEAAVGRGPGAAA